MVKVVIVEVDEYGPSVTESKQFSNIKSAEKFVTKFNRKHGVEDFEPKPTWYMYAKVVEGK